MAVKIDMEKAYDKIQWPFIHQMMLSFGFSSKWTNLVMTCIKSSSFSVLVNNEPGPVFKPTCGLRQESRKRSHKVGIKICNQGTCIPFLSFADDTIIFANANVTNAKYIKTTLDFLSNISGLKINYHKSSIQFSKNIAPAVRNNIASELQIRITTTMEKYLGIPIIAGKVKNECFEYAINKLNNQLSQWKANTLSQAGRTTLIQSNLLSQTNYLMQSFYLPTRVHNQIDDIKKKFFWNKFNSNSRALLSWDKICQPKINGGLGLHKAEHLNIALQMKLLWKIVNDNDTNITAKLGHVGERLKSAPVSMLQNRRRSESAHGDLVRSELREREREGRREKVVSMVAVVPAELHQRALMAQIESLNNQRQQSSPGSDMYGELWRACAGPLVELPRQGERVFYFPQGHMEQLEASINQDQKHQIPPPYGLTSKILCRVLYIDLRAEPDTDEVYAQITLLPEHDNNEPESPYTSTPEIPRLKVDSFCKILTASDTSTHGGFSVLRKHANECLPQLDMSQATPTQELVAKDLHGYEWHFKHIFRGQPRRHLLTTGWSTFVTSKRLVAGDAFVFLRGENGELRVGVRRLARQQTVMPSSVISSESMHLGVLATASHAVTTKTLFVVYYKPRSSQFIVTVNKYLEAVKHGFTVGMRFNKRFEGDDSPIKRFTGTIVGVGEICSQWKDSQWRSLKVQWDEPSSIHRPDRVSPWEIEPFTPSIPVNPNPTIAIKSKRPRPNDISVSDAGNGSTPPPNFWYKSTQKNQGDKIWSPSPHVNGSLKLFTDSVEHGNEFNEAQNGSKASPNSSCLLFGIDLKLNHTLPTPQQETVAAADNKEQSQIPLNSAPPSTRSRTKVQMQGVAVGRAVDLTAMHGYEELINELEKLFDIKGQLQTRENWAVVFTDDEGDMMLLGDDPWEEFCRMVKKISIYTSEEVKKISPKCRISPSTADGDVLDLDTNSEP
ncbi:uncharacterized protein [Phyllobates terribilis]|uniref:uncharacterized protein n=1 Tax=Phyllobates terribilis TaxID=111132 RepID=UPI003CCA9A19